MRNSVILLAMIFLASCKSDAPPRAYKACMQEKTEVKIDYHYDTYSGNWVYGPRLDTSCVEFGYKCVEPGELYKGDITCKDLLEGVNQ